MTGRDRLSVRVDLANGGRFGPGKAALLSAINQHGSISKAAQSLSMSYPKALKLIEEMNRDFRQPLVASSHGGASRGGSELTPTGRDALKCYSDIRAAAEAAGNDAISGLASLQASK